MNRKNRPNINLKPECTQRSEFTPETLLDETIAEQKSPPLLELDLGLRIEQAIMRGEFVRPVRPGDGSFVARLDPPAGFATKPRAAIRFGLARLHEGRALRLKNTQFRALHAANKTLPHLTGWPASIELGQIGLGQGARGAKLILGVFGSLIDLLPKAPNRFPLRPVLV